MCKFDIAWVGRCKAAPEQPFCANHAFLKCCACGEQATRECDHTAQFVCGFPLCDNCVGTQDHSAPYGMFGFGGHRHRRRDDLKQTV